MMSVINVHDKYVLVENICIKSRQVSTIFHFGVKLPFCPPAGLAMRPHSVTLASLEGHSAGRATRMLCRWLCTESTGIQGHWASGELARGCVESRRCQSLGEGVSTDPRRAWSWVPLAAHHPWEPEDLEEWAGG